MKFFTSSLSLHNYIKRKLLCVEYFFQFWITPRKRIFHSQWTAEMTIIARERCRVDKSFEYDDHVVLVTMPWLLVWLCLVWTFCLTFLEFFFYYFFSFERNWNFLRMCSSSCTWWAINDIMRQTGDVWLIAELIKKFSVWHWSIIMQ